MIDPKVFRVSRERARQQLPPEVASESFGYFIDVPNDWESARCPEAIIDVFGIHRTHLSRYPEIVAELGTLTDAERRWALRYVGFYDRVSRLMATTGTRVPLQYDIAETLFDWRTILKFVDLPLRILDYGAGGGRQAVSAFLRDPRCVYTAVDSTLSGYTAQNMVYSFMEAIDLATRTRDLLDFEASAMSFPGIAEAEPGTCFHIPAWLLAGLVPERYFTLITACHVHNELSRSDFLRLVAAVERGLADDGILYMRSELWAEGGQSYFDCIDFHGIDPVALLAEKGIVPVYSAIEAAFQTTVFARTGSVHHCRALASDAVEARCVRCDGSRAISELVTRAYIDRRFSDAAASGARVVAVREPASAISAVLDAALGRWPGIPVVTDVSADTLAGADVMVVGGSAALVETCAGILGENERKLRHQYWRAPVFLYRSAPGPVDPLFEGALRIPADVDRSLGRPAAPLPLSSILSA